MPGYLDIGLNDTMGDLFVNFIGAATFSILGYIGMRHAGRHKKASLVFDLVPSREQDTALDDNYAFAEDDGFTDGIDENGQQNKITGHSALMRAEWPRFSRAFSLTVTIIATRS